MSLVKRKHCQSYNYNWCSFEKRKKYDNYACQKDTELKEGIGCYKKKEVKKSYQKDLELSGHNCGAGHFLKF